MQFKNLDAQHTSNKLDKTKVNRQDFKTYSVILF